MRPQVIAALSFALLVTACSPPAPETQKSDVPPPAAAAGATAEGMAGHVVGRSPAASGGFPSIVLLESLAEGDPPPQVAVPVMDQVQQTFLPPILFVRTGQPTEFRNNDDVLHNVRVREDATKAPAFNVAIPTGEKYRFTFARDGFYDVGCDIHPGMSAQIVSSVSPYVTLAEPDGNFTIDGVPPGSYRAVVYAGAQRYEKIITLPDVSGVLDLTAP